MRVFWWGIFLYSRAFQIVVDLDHKNILNIFAKATHYIAEGEILQLVNCNNPDTTEAFYFDIIERKTAKLFEIAAQFRGKNYFRLRSSTPMPCVSMGGMLVLRIN